MTSGAARKRVLIIAPYFPPRARVGAQRPFKFARYLAERGFAPSVVSLATEAQAPSDWPRLALYAPFDRTEHKPAPASAVSLGRRFVRHGGRELGRRLDALVPIDSWWPVLMAQRARVVAFARAQASDVIWSTADPWSSHALARVVARSLGLPWVADFRDPWSLCGVRGRDRPAWVRAVDAQAERRYVSEASAVTFTAERTTQRYRAAYPALSERFITLENSFDPASYVDAWDAAQSAAAVERSDTLSLIFLGRFRALSSAARIIDVLAALRRMRPDVTVVVRCVGGLERDDMARAHAAGVGAAFESIAHVPVAHTLGLVRDNDLALLSTEPGRDEIIPAKLFDYLAAGRPIFALADSPDIAAILARTGLGTQFGAHQTEAAARALEACVEAKRTGAALPIARAHDPARTAAFCAEHTSSRLAQLLHRLVGAGPHTSASAAAPRAPHRSA